MTDPPLRCSTWVRLASPYPEPSCGGSRQACGEFDSLKLGREGSTRHDEHGSASGGFLTGTDAAAVVPYHSTRGRREGRHP